MNRKVIRHSADYIKCKAKSISKEEGIIHTRANFTGNLRENITLDKSLGKQQFYKKFVGVIVSGWLGRKVGKGLGICKLYQCSLIVCSVTNPTIKCIMN